VGLCGMVCVVYVVYVGLYSVVWPVCCGVLCVMRFVVCVVGVHSVWCVWCV
jgi:hypothetical protein